MDPFRERLFELRLGDTARALPWPARKLFQGLVLAAALLPAPAFGQVTSPDAPQIQFSPAGGDVGTGSSLALTLTLRSGGPTRTTAKVWVNDQQVTSALSGTAVNSGPYYTHTIGTTVQLVVGENRVMVEGCYYDSCVRKTTTFRRFSASRMAPQVSYAFAPDRRVPNPFEAMASVSTPAYTSRGQERAVKLRYLSGQAAPQGIVEVDARDYTLSDPPATMSIQVRTPAGVVLTPEIFYRAGTGATRLTARWDASSYATSALVHTVVVRSWWADGSFMENWSSPRVVVVNETQSPFGAGWTMEGLQQLRVQADSSIVLTSGDGHASVFEHGSRTCIPISSSPQISRCTYPSPAGDFSTLALFRYAATPSQNYYLRSYVDGSTTRFLADGRISSTADRFANTTTFGWVFENSRYVPSTMTDPAGLVTHFEYHRNGDMHHGKLNSVRDPGARLTYFTYYDGRNNLTHVAHPDNVGMKFTYGSTSPAAQHLLTGWTDRAGAAFALSFDHAGLVSQIRAPAVAGSTNGALLQPATTQRSGVARVLPAVSTTRTSPARRVVPDSAWYVMVSARGDSTMMLLDRWGLPAVNRDAAGKISSIHRDAQARDSMLITVLNDTTVQRWSGALLSLVATGAGRQEIWYTTYGLPREVKYGRHVTRYWYNGAGAMDSMKVSPAVGRDRTLRYSHDAQGRRISETDSAGRTTTFQHQAGGFQNLASTTRPGNAVESYGYDGLGRRTSVTNAAGGTHRVQYDAVNRVTEATDPLGNRIHSTFGPEFLNELRDPESQRHAFQRNVLGWDTVRVDPRGLSTRVRYSIDGQVATLTNRRNQVVETVYDERGRLIEQRADGLVTTLRYDPAGRFVVAQNAESLDTTFIDGRGRIEREATVRNGQRISVHSYYNLNEPTRFSVDGAEFHHASGPRMAGQEHGDTLRTGGGDTRFDRHGDGTLAWIRLPMGLRMDFGYSPNGPWVTSMAFSDTAVQRVLGTTYARDVLGRLIGRGGWTYGYDDAGRLNQAGPVTTRLEYRCTGEGLSRVCRNVPVLDNSAVVPFTYDSAGNPAEGTIGTGNRLERLGDYTMQYDEDGNLTHRYRNGVLEQRFTWSSLGRLTEVWTSGVGTTTFGYDAIGRRVRKTAPGNVVTRYVYDGNHVLYELNGAGSHVASYTYYAGVDRPHSMYRGGQYYYYVQDHQGSVTGLISSTGAVTNVYQYDAWGNAVVEQEGVANPLRFTGREYDRETGLYYYRARYYDPRIRRFISEDPAGLDGGINLYAYVGNDPVNRTDPTGLCAMQAAGYELTRDEMRALERQLRLSGINLRTFAEEIGCSSWLVPRPSERNAAVRSDLVLQAFEALVGLYVEHVNRDNGAIDDRLKRARSPQDKMGACWSTSLEHARDQNSNLREWWDGHELLERGWLAAGLYSAIATPGHFLAWLKCSALPTPGVPNVNP